MTLARRKTIPAALCVLALVASGCSATRSYTTHSASDPGQTLVKEAATTGETPASSTAAGETSSEPSSSASAASTPGVFPVTVKSCSQDLTFKKAPTNVVMLGVSGAATMNALGVLDHVKYRTGVIRKGAFTGAVEKQLEAIPTIAAAKQDTGGSKVSTEALLSARPDLVIGYDSGVDRKALTEAGIPFYSPKTFCPGTKLGKASFDWVTKEIDTFGKIFGVESKATAADSAVKQKLADIDPQGGGSYGAALYVTPGSKTFYAYGNSSMVQPIFAVNKLQNTYADNGDRVFDASMEDLLKRNPDWIVLLSDDGSDAQARQTFLGFPGAGDLKAVREKHVVVLPFALTDPPSPLSVKGAVALNKAMIQATK